MDYVTYYENCGETLSKITEYVEQLKALRNCLTTELLDTTVGNFDVINIRLDNAIAKLENIKNDISGNIQILSVIHKNFSS